MESELARHAQTLFGERLTRRVEDRVAETSPPGSPTETPADETGERQAAADASAGDASPFGRLNITPRQQRRLWGHVESIENFWTTLNEIESGAIARLSAIAADRRWEIIFLTKRPETAGATAQVQTQRWLEAKGFSLPSVYVVQGSRGHIAAALALDIVVDDRPENCLDVVDHSRARAILVWRDDQKQLPAAARRLGIGVVTSVAECLDILTQADSKSAATPGVMDRLKRLLGLKESANA